MFFSYECHIFVEYLNSTVFMNIIKAQNSDMKTLDNSELKRKNMTKQQMSLC